jgi:hypothetical protein
MSRLPSTPGTIFAQQSIDEEGRGCTGHTEFSNLRHHFDLPVARAYAIEKLHAALLMCYR